MEKDYEEFVKRMGSFEMELELEPEKELKHSVHEILEHHGVKGMKWGVRNYKQIRKSANKQLKVSKKTSEQAFKQSVKYATASGKVSRTANKLSKTTNNVKAAKLENELKKRKDKFEKASEKYDRILSKNKESVKKYRNEVEKASKLPIEIQIRRKQAIAKQVVRDTIKLAAGSALATTGIHVPYSIGGPTKNDLFAEQVNERKQKNRR